MLSHRSWRILGDNTLALHEIGKSNTLRLDMYSTYNESEMTKKPCLAIQHLLYVYQMLTSKLMLSLLNTSRKNCMAEIMQIPGCCNSNAVVHGTWELSYMSKLPMVSRVNDCICNLWPSAFCGLLAHKLVPQIHGLVAPVGKQAAHIVH